MNGVLVEQNVVEESVKLLVNYLFLCIALFSFFSNNKRFLSCKEMTFRGGYMFSMRGMMIALYG